MLVESLNPRFALFLVTALMLEQPVLLVAAPGSDELLMHAGEWHQGKERGAEGRGGRFDRYCAVLYGTAVRLSSLLSLTFRSAVGRPSTVV